MVYREAPPRAELRPYINCFWTIRSPRPATVRDRTFPDGCQEIVFNVDTAVLRSDDGAAWSANPTIELIGQMTRPYDIATRGRHCLFGVKFYPHSFSAFTRESVHDLKDQSIELQYLLQPAFARAADAVLARPSFERFVALMEDYFLEHLAAGVSPDRSYRVVDRAVGILLREKEETRIDELPRRVGVSERSLQLMFRRHVGLSPKQLLKMIRFQKTFRYLHNTRVSLTDVAQYCGYYDHAHFAHEFKSLTGVSPSTYRSMDTPLNGFFLNEASRAYLCNFKD